MCWDSQMEILHWSNFSTVEGSYSPYHIAQIMDFLDFLHEYCEEKSETFTEF